jgi:hypothetical protein
MNKLKQISKILDSENNPFHLKQSYSFGIALMQASSLTFFAMQAIT